MNPRPGPVNFLSYWSRTSDSKKNLSNPADPATLDERVSQPFSLNPEVSMQISRPGSEEAPPVPEDVLSEDKDSEEIVTSRDKENPPPETERRYPNQGNRNKPAYLKDYVPK